MKTIAMMLGVFCLAAASHNSVNAAELSLHLDGATQQFPKLGAPNVQIFYAGRMPLGGEVRLFNFREQALKLKGGSAQWEQFLDFELLKLSGEQVARGLFVIKLLPGSINLDQDKLEQNKGLVFKFEISATDGGSLPSGEYQLRAVMDFRANRDELFNQLLTSDYGQALIKTISDRNDELNFLAYQAHKFLALREPAQAKNALQQLLALVPDDDLALAQLGQILELEGEYGKAAESYEKLLQTIERKGLVRLFTFKRREGKEEIVELLQDLLRKLR